MVLLALALPVAPARAANDAWWLTAEFATEGKSVEGLPLIAFDSSWVAASALREDMFPPEAREKGESVAEHDGHLTLTMDLDGDHRPERAVVGVYHDSAGAAGRFLLILAQDRRGRLRKKALFAEPGSAGFSVLYRADATVVWSFCMECDTACAVALEHGALALDCDEE